MKPFPSDLARAHVPLMCLAAVGVLLASPTATRGESASAPDSAQTALVRFAVLTFEDVRVVAGSTKLLGQHGVVSPDGLQLRTDITSGTSISSSPQVRLVPWAEIESIEVRKGSSGAGALVGGVLGLVIGSLITVFAIEAEPLSPHNGTPILVGLVGGATLGLLVDRPGPWKTVYP